MVGSITYMVNKNLQKTETKTSNESYHQQVAKICLDAVDDYLMQVNRQGLSIIDKYQQQLEIIIQFNRSELPLEIQQKQIELQKWQNSLSELNQQLQKSLDIPITDEFKIEAKTFNSPEIKPPQTQTKSSVYSFSGKGVKEEVVIPRKAPQQQQNQQTNQTTTKKSPPSSPPPPAHDLEAKFSAWEIDQEIAQMKANMGKSGFNRSKKNNNQQNQTNKDNKSNNKSQA